MATMISEVFMAFKKAGIPEEDARSATEALSAENLATKDGIRRLEMKFDKELLIVKWMLGLIIVLEVSPHLKALFA